MEKIDKVNELEGYILTEFQGEKESSFMYQLNKNSYFDKGKFDKLLSNCDNLAKVYEEVGKSDNYVEVTKGIFVIFEHVFFLLVNHFIKEDFYTIKNYNKNLTADDISNYYFRIRMITKKIIL